MRFFSMPAGLCAGVCLAMTLTALSVPAVAEDFHAGDLTIVQPWARATPPGAKSAAGYFTITNHGTSPDRLTGGSIVAAESTSLHESMASGSAMTMHEVGPQEITPGGSLTFAPMGKHVMFTKLKQPLVAGQVVNGTLTFEKAGTVTVRFTVAPIGAMAPSAAP